MTRFSTERLSVVTFTERPDLLPKVFSPEIQSAVPEFMRHDPIGALYFGKGHLEHYGEFGLAAIDPANPEIPLARAFSSTATSASERRPRLATTWRRSASRMFTPHPACKRRQGARTVMM